MDTVNELIEILKQCPQDYPIFVRNNLTGEVFRIYTVGIDPNEKTVDIFLE